MRRAPRAPRRPESVAGLYVALPYVVLDSGAWIGASDAARSLLIELARQHDGKNNGHLHLARDWLARRGRKSVHTVMRATEELIERRLIVRTYQGGWGRGASRYALTWHSVTDHRGLDLLPSDYRRGAYALTPADPTPRTSRPSPAPPKKKIHGDHGVHISLTTGCT
jgi:hypothetical protein